LYQMDSMIKLVVVGDRGVGKSSQRFISPTQIQFFHSCHTDIAVGPREYKLYYFDTSANDLLCPLTYPQTDVFLVGFSVAQPSSFQDLQNKWLPELHHHCSGVPALKADSDQGPASESTFIRTEQGRQMARKLGVPKYIECSAKTHEGVTMVFDEAATVAVAFRTCKGRKRACVVL
ncbi:P-loop containing nucleoside triphosphate hydrolase protein, partial [Favolaschia claudopus]